MGQEISNSRFCAEDFQGFHRHLTQESAQLQRWLGSGRCSGQHSTGGFEIEACLIDASLRPAPLNERFLEKLNDPLACEELARFNFELNNPPLELKGTALSRFEADLTATWQRARKAAHDLGIDAVQIGILPTLRATDITLRNMSDKNRYRALNQQVLASRNNRALRLNIVGAQVLRSTHHNVMLESAATSFQIHLKIPADSAHRYYNGAIIASAAMVAVSANSPFLFSRELWDETRIPLFEQAVEAGGFAGAAHGPLRRVSFGSGYARESIMECFTENLEHFPILLPVAFTQTDTLPHLRLHNGTIWRWNRPLLGFEEDGTPHIRIEHRSVPAGPSTKDAIANAALFYGLTQHFAQYPDTPQITFAQAKDNFYQAARHGLRATLSWHEGEKIALRQLLLKQLIPAARAGLQQMNIDPHDNETYMNIIEQRVVSMQNGSEWQRRYILAHGHDMHALTQAYVLHQGEQRPVHEWDIE